MIAYNALILQCCIQGAKLTPAIKILQQKKIAHQIHEYQHDSQAESYGMEAVHKLGLDENIVFKTLVIALQDGKLATAVVPVARQLNMKSAARALKAKKAQMGDPATVERVTGYVLGGVSPLGQKRLLPTVIDDSALPHRTVFVSAGRRGLEIEIDPQSLADLLNASFAAITQP